MRAAPGPRGAGPLGAHARHCERRTRAAERSGGTAGKRRAGGVAVSVARGWDGTGRDGTRHTATAVPTAVPTSAERRGHLGPPGLRAEGPGPLRASLGSPRVQPGERRRPRGLGPALRHGAGRGRLSWAALTARPAPGGAGAGAAGTAGGVLLGRVGSCRRGGALKGSVGR